MEKFTKLSKAEMKKIMGAEGAQFRCLDFGNVCSPIFEDKCCEGLVCKGASGTSPGFCYPA